MRSISTGVTAKVVVTGAEAGIDAFYIFGFAGEDTIIAGAFDFALTIDGGTESDTVSYAGATSGVTVNLLNPALNDGVAAKHTYISIDSVIGSAFDDFLIGTNEANTINGGASADYLQGLNGDDT